MTTIPPPYVDASLEIRSSSQIRAARQQPFKIGLGHRQRQLAQIVATFGGDIEGAKLDLFIVLAGMQRIEIGNAVHAQNDGLAIDDELLHAVLRAASTIRGYWSVQL